MDVTELTDRSKPLFPLLPSHIPFWASISSFVILSASNDRREVREMQGCEQSIALTPLSERINYGTEHPVPQK